MTAERNMGRDEIPGGRHFGEVELSVMFSKDPRGLQTI